MIWADRIGVVLLVGLGFAFYMKAGFGEGYGTMLFAFACVPWLALRALDFIATGRVRRG